MGEIQAHLARLANWFDCIPVREETDSRIGKIDVDAGGTPTAQTTEAVASETAVGATVFVTENGLKAF